MFVHMLLLTFYCLNNDVSFIFLYNNNNDDVFYDMEPFMSILSFF